MSPPSPSVGLHRVVDVFLIFLKLGLTSFGGPVAHLGYFQRELVDKRQWLDAHQYSSLLALCQFLPGPASSQVGFALGLLRAGWAGGIAAFIGFTLPSALLMAVAAIWLFKVDNSLLAGVVHGLKLVAAIVVADAVWGMSRKLCPDNQRRGLAILAAFLLWCWQGALVSVLLVIAGAGFGYWRLQGVSALPTTRLAVGYGRRTALLCGVIFLLLLAGLPLLAGVSDTASLLDIFYRAGALVFGGGHVVLPLLEQGLVTPGLVSAEQFLTGYGLAQAMPGPLFTFASWLGALTTDNGPVFGAVLALLALFLPGFLLLIAALPVWHWLQTRPGAVAAVAGANAIVVGILLAALINPVLPAAVSHWLDVPLLLLGGWWLIMRKGSVLWLIGAGVGVTGLMNELMPLWGG
ncbi:chromate efflux transporter [Parathalassolituus penaei]|uniref:Chromate efflux transporter n=1 Tax=Parathalassolituus penaei TaxID=2997323 RepID=A0A9X3IT47_9GAMM|nr:chromate efflux transporter [Parathalassolituus penaei]MCY0966516.1 chromate efflux transporter [Parathalassolituus penaei]